MPSIRFVMLATLCVTTLHAAERLPLPRSDGQTLHVDFEQYADGWVGPVNAGVRWLGDPFTDIKQNVVDVLREPDAAFAGERCAYVFTNVPDERGRVMFQRAYDAPEFEYEVIEFVFRPAREGAADLNKFEIWTGLGYSSGKVGIQLIANGDVASGAYVVDVVSVERHEKVLTDLAQTQWMHFVLRRDRAAKTVDLWAGPPDSEVFIGTYPDLDPERATGRAEVGDTSSETVIGSGYWDDIRIGAPLAMGGEISPAETMRDVSREVPEIAYPIVVDDTKQLFVDDVLIESMDGLERTFHSVQKHPDNPLLVPETAWETGGTWYVPYNVLWQEPGKTLRTWYGAYRRSADKLTYTCVADSTDGIHWNRLSLGVFDFEGSTDNNIIWAGRAIKVNYDLQDPDPARRYKGMMRSDGFTAMYSPDGLDWSISEEPAIQQCYDATSFHWNPVENKWISSVKIWHDGKRARGYAESTDFDHWTDTYLMLKADERDHPADQTYSMWVSHYESVFIGLLKIFHVATDRCDVQLAFSRNAKQWERPWREPFIDCSPTKGDYDYGNLDPVADPIPMGDELWIYYGGRSLEHYEPPTDTNGSLCLATLRLDGFASIGGNGTLVTKPIVLEGDALYMNADAKGGEIRVEILDAESGNPIEKLGETDCLPIRTDSVRHAIEWNESEGIDSVRDRPVRFRFDVKNAHLYAIWME
ncbi:MAG: hypothetical protein AMXMBFR82_06540 [Candidatus Hydrogenedentota bacterium]